MRKKIVSKKQQEFFYQYQFVLSGGEHPEIKAFICPVFPTSRSVFLNFSIFDGLCIWHNDTFVFETPINFMKIEQNVAVLCDFYDYKWWFYYHENFLM